MTYARDENVQALAQAFGEDMGEVQPNVRKLNTEATRAPLPTDDASLGYGVGSRWLWHGQEWVAVDVTPGGARWVSASASFDATAAAPMNGVDDDAPHIQAAFDLANSLGLRDVIVPGDPTIKTTVYLYGDCKYRFSGTVTFAGTGGAAFEIIDEGGYQTNGQVDGLDLVGNDSADIGLKLINCRYWTLTNIKIKGFNKPGAWGVVFTSTADNRNASSNMFINPNISNCTNLMRFGRDPSIVGSMNTGSSFNTIVGGYLGPFGDDSTTEQYGIQNEVGEGNKFLNVRVSTRRHYTVCWDVMDARTQMIGCAGDGPCFTAFVYPLGGTGSVDSITLLEVPMLTTPVAWAGTRQATADAIVAQIVADGKQYPATEFRAIAHDEQVMFFRVEGGVEKLLSVSEIGQITVTKSASLDVGNSSINQGLLQGAPYVSYQDVYSNQWGYRTGHGGVRGVYGFRLRNHPSGSGSASGSLVEPEGNGPRHIVWFEDDNEVAFRVDQAGASLHGGRFLTTDAVFVNRDGGINALIDPNNGGTCAHTNQMLRILPFGPMVQAYLDLNFTPTFTGAAAFYVELPQLPGVSNTTKPLDVAGMYYHIPVTVTGLTGAAAGKGCRLVIYGGASSPNGHPVARLMMADSAALITTGHMTSGTAVRIRGWGQWPVDRFA